MSDDLVERVARAWAIMDGKADRFDACKADTHLEEVEGRYLGYKADAEALLETSGVAAEITRIRAQVEAANALAKTLPTYGFECEAGPLTSAKPWVDFVEAVNAKS